MKREPAIHVKAKYLEELIPGICAMNDAGSTTAEIMSMIFKELKGKEIRNRSIFKVTARKKKKIDKIVQNAQADVATFQRLLVTHRKSINHKRITLINVGDSEYGMLKEVAGIADEFVETFGLDKKIGYSEFISRFFRILGRAQFGLNKFKFYKQRIFDNYEAVVVMREDLKRLDNKQNTQKVYSTWRELMDRYAGEMGVLDNEDEFIHMVFARQEADDLGADYADYLEAQFEKLNQMGLVPEFGALYGMNARKRYRSYRAEKYAQDKDKEKPLDKNMSDEQRRYMEIRNRRSTEDSD